MSNQQLTGITKNIVDWLGYKSDMTFEERQKFYAKGVNVRTRGLLLMGVGIALFILMGFIASALRSMSMGSIIMLCWVCIPIGMGITVCGAVMCSLARYGDAAIGLTLDPKKERIDLLEQNQGRGGQLSDILEQVPQLNLNKTKEIIKIKCQDCKHLNDEIDKFCGGCGKPI
jgi:hypothetical protein